MTQEQAGSDVRHIRGIKSGITAAWLHLKTLDADLTPGQMLRFRKEVWLAHQRRIRQELGDERYETAMSIIAAEDAAKKDAA